MGSVKRWYQHNRKTTRAVVIAWLQARIGWWWHLPARLWNIWRYHTEPEVDPEEFRERIKAATARIRAANDARVVALQVKADADAAAMRLRMVDPPK